MMIHPMIHPGLASLNGQWDKNEYTAGYRARLAAIPDFDGAHHCLRVGLGRRRHGDAGTGPPQEGSGRGQGRRLSGDLGSPIRRWRRCADERHPLPRRAHGNLERGLDRNRRQPGSTRSRGTVREAHRGRCFARAGIPRFALVAYARPSSPSSDEMKSISAV